MRFILLVITFVQLQQYAASVSFVQKAGSSLSTKFKVPAGVYELRRISEDEIGSIKSDRIVTVEQDQPMLKASGGIRNGYQALKRHQIPESYGHSGVLSVSAADDGQEYAQGQGRYQSEVVPVSAADGRYNYMPTQKDYQTQSGLSKHEYMQVQRGYQPIHQPTQQNDSPSELISTPAGQHYMQSPLQGAQQNYRAVNENSEEAVSISLPGYQAVGNAQNYLHSLRQPQQVPGDYQVVNEGPAAHVVNMPGAASYPVLPQNSVGTGPHYAQTQNEDYKPFDGSYIPHNQQPEMQYAQQAPMKIPLALLSGAEAIQQQGQLWSMIRNSRTASNASPPRSHVEQPKRTPK